MGYSASDIITTLFRVVKGSPGMNEYLKLEYIKVRQRPTPSRWHSARWPRPARRACALPGPPCQADMCLGLIAIDACSAGRPCQTRSNEVPIPEGWGVKSTPGHLMGLASSLRSFC